MAYLREALTFFRIAVGVSAMVGKNRSDEETIENLLEKKWWDSEEEIKRVGDVQFRVETFLKLPK